MQNLIVVTNVLGDLATNCYTVVNTATREAIIIDPAANAEFLLEMIKNQQYKLTKIFLTHGHFDHILGIEGIKKAYPDVPVVIGKNDEDILATPAANLSMMFSGDPVALKADETVNDNDVVEILGTKVKCIEVPGHTKGGMCFYFEENKMLFAGDTLFAGSIGRSDFPTGDGEALVRNIKEKLLVLPEDTVVYPGHNNRTTIGREKVDNWCL
ncbi:Glyoxylase, beta-lactamase superfamily II [Eubacterium ruminantium]|jgi:glyoxylase-like metal-dependent hydrolase (beta-lactamase superfamily II)|uniref:Glyoxylase, beta-lactamase superfamily II n=1 Tax=Eubacterium ruminantium TaxID=42322 RepID=A0A1T4KFW8_9FIRM|nr:MULTISPECIES: MBL fold metallo-hydrolase [Eubacterium]MCR5368708.1 MBL fold metallo-hydrolase [Eubacterium sp.]SCW31645.1 Glyoxylase, beta-lactamase superfamily II [Eubacterium ruminantium]SDM26179.1 Glyoxylase, beta-lactamase superfamily II [Eubacterium ruminantium]SJZ41265.1 Glyoxylase, beta-lactamase superfamily II [Eubacterium ruminantium]